MIQLLLNKTQQFVKAHLALIFLLAFSISLLIFRILFLDSITYIFLIWNLFLAAIPFILTTLVRFNVISLNKITFIPFFIIWMLFFPNSPYIITDLFHITYFNYNRLWFDLILIFSFAWNGLLLGFLSLNDLLKIKGEVFSQKSKVLFIAIIFVLTGFGLYLGRLLRLNSWEVFTNPTNVLHAVYVSISQSILNPNLLIMSVLYSTFLFLAYFTTENSEEWIVDSFRI